MDHYIIPKGSILFRCAVDTDLTPRYCKDTGKTGVYFANYLLLAVAMTCEYKQDLQLGVYITNDVLYLQHGKYSFRYINPSRYFYKINGGYDLKLHVKVLEEENISHYDNTMFPILEGNYNYDVYNQYGEIFLTGDDLKKIKLIDKFQVNYMKLSNAFKKFEGKTLPIYHSSYVDCLTKIIFFKTLNSI